AERFTGECVGAGQSGVGRQAGQGAVEAGGQFTTASQAAAGDIGARGEARGVVIGEGGGGGGEWVVGGAEEAGRLAADVVAVVRLVLGEVDEVGQFAVAGTKLRQDGPIGREVLGGVGDDEFAAVHGRAACEVVVGAGVVVVDGVAHR